MATSPDGKTALPRFELLDIKGATARRPPVWLIDQALPARAVAVLYGKEGVGKTFLALDWGLSLASGTAWQDRAVRAGPVVFVMGEGVGGGLGQRLEAWLRMHRQGKELPVRFLLQPTLLLDQAHEAALVGSLERFADEVRQPPSLVVIDTLARAMAGEEENSARVMGKVVSVLERVRDRLGATVLVIHHSRKQGDSERGSNALAAGADAVFRLSAGRRADGLVLHCAKVRDAPNFEPFYLRRSIVSLGPEGQTSCVLVAGQVEPVDAEGRAGRRNAAQRHQHERVREVLAGKPAGATIQDIRDWTGLGDAVVRKVLREASDQRNGVVKDGKRGKAEIYRLQPLRP